MLSDLFESLDIDDGEFNKKCVQFITPSEYSAKIDHAGWFFSQGSYDIRLEDDRELINNRAVYFYYYKDFKNAYEVPSFGTNDLLSYLSIYKQSASSYGDWLQYLIVAKDVFANISCVGAAQTFIETVGKNFHIGYTVRAITLLERDMKNANGFVVRIIKKKLETYEKQLEELGYSDSLIREARLNMGCDMVPFEESRALDDHYHVHDSKLKIGFFRTAEYSEHLLKEFRKKFAWMFEGCSFYS
ncbi:hypothetical protein DICVIV_10441 [Dictyocaulus viviparus]|uniref:Uncharacterized protein n=1 Tax=Dictyocaulus viviparus TaxID=29172 RepID=A0A0D8XFS3_DICVI|nr:hypothetical protein DICVIV_10441 [Dictyocaulus viviparus]